jgi:hypothetical protein
LTRPLAMWWQSSSRGSASFTITVLFTRLLLLQVYKGIDTSTGDVVAIKQQRFC